ncbi:MAG: nuclear transport factor 2 family protein [Lysobacterales bacterium]|nr:MAG: nuclear transport factor 2 family protein [Xanthomonadales bacterium]
MNKWLRVAMTAWAVAWPAFAGASECVLLSAAHWMLGDWVTGGEKTVFHESWTELGPQTFEGMGSERSLVDGKVIATEVLRLVEMAGGIFYIAKVAHNELPVAFRLTECSTDLLLFENPAHDFPRRLEYRHDADGTMMVAVSDGKDKGFTLNFERVAAAADPKAPVLAAEDARFAAMTGANVSELGSWLDDDLQYVHSTGQVESREQFLAAIAGGAFRYLEIAPLERQVVMLGHESALVRGHARIKVLVSGNRLELTIRYLAIYGLGGDGHWRLRAWQSLRLPQQSG